jgi:hypothetical protein
MRGGDKDKSRTPKQQSIDFRAAATSGYPPISPAFPNGKVNQAFCNIPRFFAAHFAG